MTVDLKVGDVLAWPALRPVVAQLLAWPEPAFAGGVAMLAAKVVTFMEDTPQGLREGMLVEVCTRLELAEYCADCAAWWDPRWRDALRADAARILAGASELPILVFRHEPPSLLFLLTEEDLAALAPRPPEQA